METWKTRRRMIGRSAEAFALDRRELTKATAGPGRRIAALWFMAAGLLLAAPAFHAQGLRLRERSKSAAVRFPESRNVPARYVGWRD